MNLTSFSTTAALNYAASRPDRHLTGYCNNATGKNYLSAHDAVSPPVTSLVFVQDRHTRFSISHCTNSIYWIPKITIMHLYKYTAKLHMQCYIQLPLITYAEVHEPVHGILLWRLLRHKLGIFLQCVILLTLVKDCTISVSIIVVAKDKITPQRFVEYASSELENCR